MRPATKPAIVLTVAEHQRRLATPPSPPCRSCGAPWVHDDLRDEWMREHEPPCVLLRNEHGNRNTGITGRRLVYPVQHPPG